jgi:[ribosomal protein S18]-alanine N-acetyltransferase
MVVHRATTQDAEEFARVLATVAEEGLLATEAPVDIESWSAKARRTIDGPEPDSLWVLEDHGRVVGAAGVHSTAVAGVLSLGMMVLAEFRGRGGGRALLASALDHARASGAHKLELEVWPDNAPAIKLYETAGFEVEGLGRAHYRRRDGSLRSALLMAIALASQDDTKQA